MSITNEPPGYEPPTSAQLVRSTLLALVVAAALLIGVVLPSEYGIDPTGVGTALGLTRMGEIKTQLAEEAEADRVAEELAVAEVPSDAVGVGTATEALAAGDASLSEEDLAAGADPNLSSATVWRDETTLVLAPDESAELKLVMSAGDRAEYAWTAEGGALNFNAHGHGGGESVTYGKGRGVQRDDGTLSATFDGQHGWFWRNRSGNPVSLTLSTRGQYSELKRTRP